MERRHNIGKKRKESIVSNCVYKAATEQRRGKCKEQKAESKERVFGAR